MARKSRDWTSGTTNHVIARGNRRQAIFVDDLDRRRFLAEVIRFLPAYQAVLYAYCLMPNHLHLLIRAIGSLSELMHRIQTSYASYFNDRHGHVGHLFQDRFKDRTITSDRYLANVLDYIHSNPVKAQLAKQTTDWAWSSAREYAGLRSDPFVTVLGGIPPATLSPDKMLEENGFLRDLSASLEELFQREAHDAGVSADVLRSNSRNSPVPDTRRRFVGKALAAGYRTAEIAEYLKCSSPTISRLSQARPVPILSL